MHQIKEEAPEVLPKNIFLKTTETIKNTPVTFKEVTTEPTIEEGFIITNITPLQEEEIVEEKTTQMQADLLFDLPLNAYKEIKPGEEITFTVNKKETTNTSDIEVVGAKEIKATPQKRFILEDFDAKPTISKSSRISEKIKEEEVKFELKTKLPTAETLKDTAISEEVSPLDLTISQLQQRAEERRQKMKGFNYKFNDQMNKNIDEIERQPAYKRLGLDLDTDTTLSKSKTAMQKNEGNIDLKSNNSFLHDNVD